MSKICEIFNSLFLSIKKIEERNKKIKEEESLKEKKNEENKEEAKEVIQVDVHNHKDDGNSKQALFEEKKIEN